MWKTLQSILIIRLNELICFGSLITDKGIVSSPIVAQLTRVWSSLLYIQEFFPLMTCCEIDEYLIVLGDLFDVALRLEPSLWFEKFQTLFSTSNEVSTSEIEFSGSLLVKLCPISVIL